MLHDVTPSAQELAIELLEWSMGKDPVASVAALLVAAAKIGAASNQQGNRMAALLDIAFREEREKYQGPVQGNQHGN
jgi:hypothetical protein